MPTGKGTLSLYLTEDIATAFMVKLMHVKAILLTWLGFDDFDKSVWRDFD